VFPQTPDTIPLSQLPPANPTHPLATEWETYRREVGRLLAAGLEGKFALIRGDAIIGVYDTWDAARRVGLEKYLLKPHMVHPILANEPVLHGPRFSRMARR
jgi:hypothetical protein